MFVHLQLSLNAAILWFFIINLAATLAAVHTHTCAPRDAVSTTMITHEHTRCYSVCMCLCVSFAPNVTILTALFIN